jgi:hypothetical protein
MGRQRLFETFGYGRSATNLSWWSGGAREWPLSQGDDFPR